MAIPPIWNGSDTVNIALIEMKVNLL
jgi:hypothetical protein